MMGNLSIYPSPIGHPSTSGFIITDISYFSPSSSSSSSSSFLFVVVDETCAGNCTAEGAGLKHVVAGRVCYSTGLLISRSFTLPSQIATYLLTSFSIAFHFHIPTTSLNQLYDRNG